MTLLRCAVLLLVASVSSSALAHDSGAKSKPEPMSDATKAEWIALGGRVHGGFGSLIALGIRIGQDAGQRLGAKPRESVVTYYEGAGSPCACVLDGAMLPLTASPGQKSVIVSPEPAGEGLFGRVVVLHKPTGKVLTYAIPASAGPGLRDINKQSEAARWSYVFDAPADSLFLVKEGP